MDAVPGLGKVFWIQSLAWELPYAAGATKIIIIIIIKIIIIISTFRAKSGLKSTFPVFS